MKPSSDCIAMAQSVEQCFLELCPITELKNRKEQPPIHLDHNKLEALGVAEVLLDPDFTEAHQLLTLIAKAQGKTLFPIPYAELLWAERELALGGVTASLAGVLTTTSSQSVQFARVDPTKRDLLYLPQARKLTSTTSNAQSGELATNTPALKLRPSIDFTQFVASVLPISVPTIGVPHPSSSTLALLRSAEAVGAALSIVGTTVEYVKTRQQFGQPVGVFQAVQHPLAQMSVLAESADALTEFAGFALDSSPNQAELVCSAAATYAPPNAVKVIEKCLQLHGGIGFTWEYDLHLYLRRAKFLEIMIGNCAVDVLDASALM